MKKPRFLSIEEAVDEELARFLAKGPTADELERVKTQTVASFIRGNERIGGFGGKSDTLAMNQVFLGQPDAWKEMLGVLRYVVCERVARFPRRPC